MPAAHPPRRGSRGIARASTRAGVLAILSALILLVGQFVAFAGQPDKATGDGNGSEVSQEQTVDSSEDSDTEESDAEEQAEADVEADADAEAEADVEAEEDSDAKVQSDNEAQVRVQGQGGGGEKITICHRTNSATNPYVVITVSVNAADGIAGNSGNEADHFGEHPGPLASSLEVAQQLKADHVEWGDIIPPIPGVHGGLNWTLEGQAMFNNGCAFVAPPTAPTLSISKGPPNQVVAEGGTVTFDVMVTNTGTAPATNVIVTDTLVAGLTPATVQFGATTSSLATCAGAISGQTVTCNVGTLAAGASAVVRITATETGTGCQYSNTASVSATGLSPVTSGSTAVTVQCVGQAALVLSKTGTPTVVNGNTITYTVTVTNSGSAAATNVIITDNLADSLTGVTATFTIGTGTCTVTAGNVVTCTAATLAANSSATITITATTPAGTCPTITNQVTGTHSGGMIPASGTVTTTVTGCATPGPTPEATVRIEKKNDANEDGIFSNNEEAKNDGQAVDFELVITNTSDVAVEITELTDSFGQTTLDLLADECSSLDGVVLDPGVSVTCTFTLPNYSPAQGTAIVNVAEVCVQIVNGVVTACDTNPSRVRTAIVLGTTVTPTPTQPPAPVRTTTPPGGIAFTGPSSALPLTALALALLTLGTGLLWVGRRRERPDMG